MNKFLPFAVLLTISGNGFVLSKPQRDTIPNNSNEFAVPKILWKLYDVLSALPSCQDLKVMSIPSQVHIRQQKIYIRAEIPAPVGSRFDEAQLRLEFRSLRDADNSSVAYRADIGNKDSRIPMVRSQGATDVLAVGLDVEMSFDVTTLLRPTLQLKRKHFSSYLKITPVKRLLTANSLNVYLIVTAKDRTCSDFSLPDLQGGTPLAPLPPTDDSPDECRVASHVVPGSDVPVSFKVLRPADIDIGGCEGSCSGRSPFSNHAALKAHHHHEKEGGKNWFRPCCAPSAVRPVLVMGQEPFSNFVSIMEVPNLRVSSCACM